MQKEIDRFLDAYNKDCERDKKILMLLLSLLAMRPREPRETSHDAVQKLRAQIIASQQDDMKQRRTVL